MLLRARLVVPVTRPPIKDGAVLVSGNRIMAVGSWRELSSDDKEDCRDLGDVALLPGLINAHCHLDYTSMAGEFPPPRVFTDWIKVLTATKAEWRYSEFAESWVSGARMLTRTGTTTVGDIENVPELLPELWDTTPLRVISFLEMTGVKSQRKPRLILQDVINKIDGLRTSRCLAGLSPHAPYSTQPELLRISAEVARKRAWRLCTHVAESAQEFEMFVDGRGEMFDWLRRSGRDMSDCGLGSPVQHMERNGALGKNLLAVHVNYLGKSDASLLARRRVSVVHCPRSHFYFRHGPFPYQELKRAGVNICLGTDSLASVWKKRGQTVELNMFEEMRAFASRNGSISPRRILSMATVNGAKALGISRQVGELIPRAFADLIAIPFRARARDVYEGILAHDGPISSSMIDGRWVIPPHAE